MTMPRALAALRSISAWVGLVLVADGCVVGAGPLARCVAMMGRRGDNGRNGRPGSKSATPSLVTVTRRRLLHCAITLLIASASAACVNKSDVPVATCPNAIGCATTGGSSDDSTGVDATTGEITTNSDPITTASTDPSTSTSAADTTSGTGSESTGSSGEDSSSTGEPADNIYAPCQSSDECTSGVCYAGFCSIVCWSQKEGEVECPAVPGDAVGVTVTCDRLGTPKGPFCEGCLDCGQYCIPSCTADSTCPGGGACIEAACSPEGSHCG